MAFMRPFYTSEDFHVGENKFGERVAIPADVYGTLERFATECEVSDPALISGKVWARLSAPGYMDATDWDGPFSSVSEAREEISRTWDVDADTGDDLDE